MILNESLTAVILGNQTFVGFPEVLWGGIRGGDLQKNPNFNGDGPWGRRILPSFLGFVVGGYKKEYELLMGLVNPPSPSLCNEIINLLDNTELD